MIISHKHRFIFLKTKKTAGTSLEIALSKFCGDDDILTPISKKDEEIRKKLVGKSSQNYLIPISKYRPFDYIGLLKGRRKSYYNHMPFYEVKEVVDNEIWNNYYKFCFERNPYDKMISYYFWEIRNNEISFSDFLKSGAMDKILGKAMYSANEKIEVNNVYKFERLDEAIVDIGKKLGLKKFSLLPFKAKGFTRKDKRHYHEIMTDYDRELIENRFKWELKNFAYDF